MSQPAANHPTPPRDSWCWLAATRNWNSPRCPASPDDSAAPLSQTPDSAHRIDSRIRQHKVQAVPTNLAGLPAATDIRRNSRLSPSHLRKAFRTAQLASDSMRLYGYSRDPLAIALGIQPAPRPGNPVAASMAFRNPAAPPTNPDWTAARHPPPTPALTFRNSPALACASRRHVPALPFPESDRETIPEVTLKAHQMNRDFAVHLQPPHWPDTATEPSFP